MTKITFKVSEGNRSDDQLHINHAAGKVRGNFLVIRFQDKDTKQFVLFMPSLGITGYGETKEKASEMLKYSLGEILIGLAKMPSAEASKCLSDHGWKHSPFRNKDFSKLHVDINGELKNFNVEEGSIERLEMVA